MSSFALALMFLISLLPIPVLPVILFQILQLPLLASLLIMELLILGGLKELYPKDKSPEMRHAVFFIIWTVCAALVIGIFAAPTGAYALNASAKTAVQDTVQKQVDNLQELKRLFDN